MEEEGEKDARTFAMCVILCLFSALLVVAFFFALVFDFEDDEKELEVVAAFKVRLLSTRR